MEVYRTTHPVTGEFIEVSQLALYKTKKEAVNHSNNVEGSFIEKSHAISTYGYWGVYLPVRD